MNPLSSNKSLNFKNKGKGYKRKIERKNNYNNKESKNKPRNRKL